MGQGSINQPGKIGSPMEGIMNALQAVHEFYGIDTQKAQQKLLDSQNTKAGAEAKMAATEAADQENFQKTGQMSPLMALKQGYQVMPGSIPASSEQPQSQPKLTPVQNQTATPDVADNGSAQTANDASPLSAHVQKISALSPQQDQSGGYERKGQVRGMQIALSGGGSVVATASPAMQKQALELQEIQQRIGNAASEEARKGRAELTGIAEKFNGYSPVIEAKNDIEASQEVLNGLASGNEASISLAKAKLPLLALGIKRMGGDGDIVDPKKLSAAIDEWMSLKSTGKPPPEAINKLMAATQQVQASASQRLNDLADTSAAQAGSIFKKDPADIKAHLLLPAGTQTRKVKSPSDDLYAKYLKQQGGKNASAE